MNLASKIWIAIFATLGLAGVVGSIVNGNLLYFGISAIILSLSIAYDPEKDVEE